MPFTLEIFSDLAFWFGCTMLFRLTLDYIVFLAIQWADDKRSILYGKTKRERLDFYRQLYYKKIAPEYIDKLSTSHAEECLKQFNLYKKIDLDLLTKLDQLKQMVES